MYAFLGILECLLKLGVAYVIYVSFFDKLKTYAFLLFCMMLIVDIYYVVYGMRNFRECHIRRIWNPSVFKEIAGFSGWTLFGAISGVLREQGINILLNIFFTPIVNAARAIAFQVNACVNQFVINFFKAVQPQITKNYGAGQLNQMHTLVLRSSRFCFYLILVLSLPILLEADFLLKLWLKDIPENTVLFTRLVVMTAVIDSTSYPLQTSISATGKIRTFQIVTGGLLLMNLPVAWIFLLFGYPPEITMYVAMAISFLAQMTRIYFTKKFTGLGIGTYLRNVVLRIVVVTCLSAVLPICLMANLPEGPLRFILVCVVSLLSCLTVVFALGITGQERSSIVSIIKQKTHVPGNR